MGRFVPRRHIGCWSDFGRKKSKKSAATRVFRVGCGSKIDRAGVGAVGDQGRIGVGRQSKKVEKLAGGSRREVGINPLFSFQVLDLDSFEAIFLRDLVPGPHK